MMSKPQKKKVIALLERGLTDPHIAELVPDLTKMEVYKFRHSLGVSSDNVRDNRYDTWVKLIQKGVPTDEIAEFYRVKEQSLRVALWRTRKISFVEVKADLKKQSRVRVLRLDEKNGLPNFDELGV